MRLNKTFKQRSLLLSLGMLIMVIMFASSSTHAATPGPYLGASLGTAHDVILDEDEPAYKYYAGVNLGRNIGLELSYVDLGSYVNGALTQDGISYELIGYLPLTSDIDIYGRAGFFDWEVANGFSANTGTDATFGVGLQAQLQDSLSLRGEFQTFMDVGGGDVDLYSASIILHF